MMFPRLSRIKYWVRFAVFVFLLFTIPLNINNAALGAPLLTATIVFFLHASVCRCHDFNYSGFTLFWLLVPVANIVVLIMLLAKNGTDGPNIYDSYQGVESSVNINSASVESESAYYTQPEENTSNSVQPEHVVKMKSKKEQLREALKAKHPYQDMVLRNRAQWEIRYGYSFYCL